MRGSSSLAAGPRYWQVEHLLQHIADSTLFKARYFPLQTPASPS